MLRSKRGFLSTKTNFKSSFSGQKRQNLEQSEVVRKSATQITPSDVESGSPAMWEVVATPERTHGRTHGRTDTIVGDSELRIIWGTPG